MKQRIDVSQLQELSLSQRDKLRQWKDTIKDGDLIWVYDEEKKVDAMLSIGKWRYTNVAGINNISDHGCGCCSDSIDITDNNWLPLLTIGEMIELIMSEGRDMNLHITISAWFIHDDAGDLCDALWKCVKILL